MNGDQALIVHSYYTCASGLDLAGFASVRTREVREESPRTSCTRSLRRGRCPGHRSIHCCPHARSSRHLARLPLRAGRCSRQPPPCLPSRHFPSAPHPCRSQCLPIRCFRQQLRYRQSLHCRRFHCCPRLPSRHPCPKTMSSHPQHCYLPWRHCRRLPWFPRRCAFPLCRLSRHSRFPLCRLSRRSRFPLRRRRCPRAHPCPSSRPRLRPPRRPSRHRRLRHRTPSRGPCSRGWSRP
jgi:hypothetical protein